ncbi:MAG: RDD family protein [Thermoleophilaceae bacterium]|nr:RDD family protein [Thermoleophilaceae bacterium]
MSEEYFTAPPEDALSTGNAAPVWELSGWWRRVGASIIDYLVVWIPISIAVGIIGIGGEATTSDNGFSANVDEVGWLFFLVASAIYFMATMSAWNGQTVGKRVTGIRVVRENGEPVDAKFAFVRQTLVIAILFNALAAVLLFIPTFLNYLWPLWDDKHQALHDKIVKSRVVREQPAGDPGTFQAAQQQAPFPTGTVTPAPAPAAPPSAAPQPPAPPAPPTPGGTSTPYTPPPGFDNPVPDDD